MDSQKDSLLSRFKWHIIIIIYVLIMTGVLLLFFPNFLQTEKPGDVPLILWFFIAALFLIALIAILSNVIRILNAVQENSTKLERMTVAMDKLRAALAQIDQSARVSETAKAIAFRDTDRQTLREAVFDKVQQHDFNAAFEIIDEIEHRAGYKNLADQLRIEANRYRDATDHERINQVITNIENLFDNHEWPKASAQVERLIRNHPGSEQAIAMRQKLIDKKEERKKILLNAWDDAIKRQATDRSLEILKELDMYLTPNEALALQEAAKDVFKTKLHNLGVQFSLAVSGKQWADALDVGRQIIRDFPNSKMATEIRQKMTILSQKVQ